MGKKNKMDKNRIMSHGKQQYFKCPLLIKLLTSNHTHNRAHKLTDWGPFPAPSRVRKTPLPPIWPQPGLVVGPLHTGLPVPEGRLAGPQEMRVRPLVSKGREALPGFGCEREAELILFFFFQ